MNDFTSFKANWEPKYSSIKKIAEEINIGLDSLVFIDDNAMEREIISSQLTSVSVPNVGNNVLDFIKHIEGNGFFEIANLSTDDINRNKFYFEKRIRDVQKSAFENYDDFLKSLEMQAEIKSFSPIYLERITQLINKTNQFNLTTKRNTITEVEQYANSSNYITLYGKLEDRFGDNELISVLIGKVDVKKCVINTFLMSCRVLKRDMEYAMLDVLVQECKDRNLNEIWGVYKPIPKNKMVANLFSDFGFEQLETTEEGSTVWKLELNKYYKPEI